MLNSPHLIGYAARNRHSWRLPVLNVLLWFILFVLCWPLAILFVVLYPLVWLLLLPFRLVGIAVCGVLELFKAVIFLPARLLGERPR